MKDSISMKTLTILSLALALTTGLSACGGEEEAAVEAPAVEAPAVEAPAANADTSLPGDAEAGAALYAAKGCVACHGADGRGNGGMTGADFVGDATRLAKGNDVLIASITDGVLDVSPIMPPQGSVMTEQEIKDVLSYIRQTFGSN